MFFLLRLAFWLGLVLVLLPRDKTPDSEKLPQISVSDAVQAATAAVSDMSQFCKRQPAACEVGGQAATVIGVRAQDGARKVYNSITDKKPAEAAKDSRKDKPKTRRRLTIPARSASPMPPTRRGRDGPARYAVGRRSRRGMARRRAVAPRQSECQFRNSLSAASDLI